LIVAGGTGGHVYPALTVADAIQTHSPQVELAFAGSIDGFERPLVEKSGVRFAAYHEVQAGPLHGINPLRALQSLVKLSVGVVQSLRLLTRTRPDAVFSTGGWVSFPVTFAAWILRIPVMIYLPDIEPGLTIKVLRHFAKKVAVTTPDSAPYFRPEQMVVTGYPLRSSVTNATRDEGRARFGLDPLRKTVLVFGGSLGSRSINSAVQHILPALMSDDTQVIHVTGQTDWERASDPKLADNLKPYYHLFPYLEEMGLAMAAADVVVCRSGASALGELPHFGLPAVLVPYPYAWRYQKVNADYLVRQGAAVIMEDANMESQLLPTLRGLLDDPARLDRMRQNAATLAQSDAAWKIGQVLLQLAGGGGR
jgi:UDP-N-acetylglucosamine--N-acetylmuramyl-(pentapeptide) pyrophosphoryl-undecaprenol N-acetylglucosamine transferase